MAQTYRQIANSFNKQVSFPALNKSKLIGDNYTIAHMCYNIFLGLNGKKQCNMDGMAYYMDGANELMLYIIGKEAKIALYKELKQGLTIYEKSNIIGEIIGIIAGIKYAVKWLEYTVKIYLEEIDE